MFSEHTGNRNSQEARVQVLTVTSCLKILDTSVFQASFFNSVKSREKPLPLSPLRLVTTSQKAYDNSLGTEKCQRNGRDSH